jgi:hypothetical protein
MEPPVMNLKAIVTSLFLALLIFLAGNISASAFTKSGSTNVSIVLPDCIILHYYSALNLNFTDSNGAVDQGGNNNWNVAWSGATSGGNQLSASTIYQVVPDLVTLTIPNAWAIRGLSPSGNAKVTLTVINNTLTSGTSKILIKNGTGDTLISDNGGHSGTSITTSLNGITTTQATMGNVKMTLDFSQTNKAGAHTGGQYKITAETI